jgi:uncharacterized membrane protein YecN with MAPEG domain
MILPISLTLAAACALLSGWLGWRVGQVRRSEKIVHGDGGSQNMVRRMRAQANFVEYTPFVLVLFALVEMALGSTTWLWLLALVYVVARVLHALGMDGDRPTKGRGIGILVTMVTLLILAIAALYAAYAITVVQTAPAPISAHA